jgi:F0F1-type ATP synthase assembly protein I
MGDNSLFKVLALATQLGFAVAGPLVLFIGGGVWLDSQLHTSPWLFFLGLALGLLSAGAALYQVAVVGSRSNSATTPRRTRTRIDPGNNDAGTDHASDERLNRP